MTQINFGDTKSAASVPKASIGIVVSHNKILEHVRTGEIRMLITAQVILQMSLTVPL